MMARFPGQQTVSHFDPYLMHVKRGGRTRQITKWVRVSEIVMLLCAVGFVLTLLGII
ncbi:MAG: hypothetical protein ABI196_10855 [Bradyrhizobium sp.]